MSYCIYNLLGLLSVCALKKKNGSIYYIIFASKFIYFIDRGENFLVVQNSIFMLQIPCFSFSLLQTTDFHHLIPVQTRTNQIHPKIHHAKPRQQPVEVLQPIPVQVVAPQPPPAHPFHHLDHH